MRKIYFFLIVSVLGVLLFGTAANSFATTSILSVNPVNGTSSVALNTALTVKFNDDAMDPASIGVGSATTNSTGTFTVSFGGTPTYIGGNIVIVGGAAKFTPIANLTANTLYTCVMATGTTNLSGTSSNGITFSFTTGTSLDNSDAGVWYTSPLNNAKNVAMDTQYVYVILNERHDPTTIGTSTITLSSSSGNAGGSVNYYDYGDNYFGTPTAIFTPTSNLDYSTLYTITVGNGITDMAGNNIGTSTYTFTTVSAPSSGGEPVKPRPLQVTEVKVNPNLDKIQVKFNYPLNGDYLRIIETKDCRLVDSSGNESQFGSLELDGNTVILYLLNKMSQNATYTLTIKGGNEGPVAASASGEVLAEDYILKFTTGTGKGIRRKEKKGQESYSPIPPPPPWATNG